MAQFSQDELNEQGIRHWDWIKDKYSSTSILLGNGFSINFSNTLRYKYLYETFIIGCTPISKELFNKFETQNFELVLESIETAKKVCDILHLNIETFDSIKTEIRQGLIDSINQIHPKPDDVNQDKIKWISQQFKKYNKIFTTNYDLFLYYIILETKIFNDNLFRYYSLKYNSFGEPDIMDSKHIYYLHGALFLFESGLTTLKIKRPNEGWLLDGITEEISANNYPLFISEGKSDSKLKAIQSNSYLSYCLKQLESNSDETLIIFGQSLSIQDGHLVKIIDKQYEKVAISIRSEDWQTIGLLKAEKSRISSMFKKTQFEFYDAKTFFDFEPKFLIQ